MAEKMKLTQELEEKIKAAKTLDEIDKLLGAETTKPEKKKLSLDELDALSGSSGSIGGISTGWMEPPDDFYLIHGLNRNDAIALLSAIDDNFGHDAAIAYAKDSWCPTNLWDKIRTNGVAWCVDELWGKAYYAKVNGYDSFM